MEGKVRAEVETLHQFFTDWIAGRCENSDQVFDEGVGRKLAPGFVVVDPTGLIRDRGTLVGMVRHGWGTNPEYLVEITDVSARPVTDETILVTYREHQSNAIFIHEPDNTRLSSAILRVDPELPGGLSWLHLHETLL